MKIGYIGDLPIEFSDHKAPTAPPPAPVVQVVTEGGNWWKLVVTTTAQEVNSCYVMNALALLESSRSITQSPDGYRITTQNGSVHTVSQGSVIQRMIDGQTVTVRERDMKWLREGVDDAKTRY
jgi:hypothetical protein